MHLHEELLARRVQVQVVGSIVLANNRRSVAPQHPHAESVQSRSSRPISGALDHAVSGAFAHYWTIQWGVCDATHTSGVEAERKLTRHAAAVCEEIQIMCTVSHVGASVWAVQGQLHRSRQSTNLDVHVRCGYVVGMWHVLVSVWFGPRSGFSQGGLPSPRREA